MALNFFNADSLYQRAQALMQAGQWQQAHAGFVQVLKIDPNHAGALASLGILSRQTGQLQQAVSLLTRALQLDPGNTQTLSQLGETYRNIGVLPEALACYDRALKIAPQQLELYNNRALVLLQMGRAMDAIASWKHITDIIGEAPPMAPRPESLRMQLGDRMARLASAAFSNIGNAHMEQGLVEESRRAHERACQWDPGSAVMQSNLLRTDAFSSAVDPVETRVAAETWWQRHAGGIEAFTHEAGRDPEKLLKIGFISADLRTHSVAYFLLGLFEKFDRTRFAFYCYAGVQRPDEITQRFQGLASAWRNVIGAPDQAVATQIKNDGIDVLIDLGGHTADNRLRVFAYRPAPVQVSYLGYAGTTGCPRMDYRITDEIADPPGMTEEHFTEKLWRLKRPAWCYDAAGQMMALPTARRVGEGGFTFGSFNAFAKVTPEVIGVWTRILQGVPWSRLILKSRALADESLRARVTEQFAAGGIAGERLRLLGRIAEKEGHLGVYQEIDLGLDTFPYNGTTTTCEALWMNVPVLTLAGRVHASRVGASLLGAVGLGELVAGTAEAYVGRAIELGMHPDLVGRMREGLRERLRKSSLMNGAEFADEFCGALRGMWRRHCGG